MLIGCMVEVSGSFDVVLWLMVVVLGLGMVFLFVVVCELC